MRVRHIGRVTSLAVAVILISASAAPVVRPTAPHVVVFKDPNCGCCRGWIEHLRKHGFDVAVRDTSDVSGAKRVGRVPQQLYSCHTAFVNGYVIEGHVPAEDIARLLAEKPRIAGLAVPGMPASSPGMDVPGATDHFDVVAFGRDGTTRTYSHH
jgi:hypothetical protein